MLENLKSVPQLGRPQELRYRVADALNDQLKRFRGFHRFLKRLFDGRNQMKTGWQSAAGPVRTQRPVEPIAIEDPLPVRTQTPQEPSVSAGRLPVPPFEMRELVGPSTVEAFDNPARGLVYQYLPVQAYEEVFDFGCGCGRVARQLILQRPQPRRYLGIDLHRGMVAWCRKNLSPIVPQFQFAHHDVFMTNFNSK